MKRFKWSLREVFLVVLIVALLLPYLPQLLPRETVRLKRFGLTESEIQQQLLTWDPSVSFSGLSGVGGGSDDYEELHSEMLISMESGTPAEAYDFLKQLIRKQVQDQGWTIESESDGMDQFSLHFADQGTDYHLFLMNLPPEPDDRKHYQERGRNLMRIMLVKYGYLR